jgi:hypothetical protein
MSSTPPDVESEANVDGTPDGPTKGSFSLENILGEDHDDVEHPSIPTSKGTATGWDEEQIENPLLDGYCIECEGLHSSKFESKRTYRRFRPTDQPAAMQCQTCQDIYCEVCFAAQHRKGSRKTHLVKPLKMATKSKAAFASTGSAVEEPVSGIRSFPAISMFHSLQQMNVDDAEDASSDDDGDWERVAVKHTTENHGTESHGDQPNVGDKVGEWFVQRSKYIPLRLTLPERKYLRLLEAALTVSEYTDKIDTIGFGLSKTKRIVHQIRELCAIMSGLLLSADYKMGQELFSDRDFHANAKFYQSVFELGRRHKIMNPDKMRTIYGKLIYLLQVCKSFL